MEPGDLNKHPKVRRVGEVGSSGKDPPRTQCASVFEAGLLITDGHRHLRLLCRDAQFGEQLQQCRVGALVVNDESGVDRQDTVGSVHVVCVGVSTEPVVGLKQGHASRFGRDVRRRQPGDTGADDRNTSGCAPGVIEVGHVVSNVEKSISATGFEVGCFDPPTGSTEIAAAVACAASPLSRTV